MSLKSEIDVKSKQIRTDSYPMSIGELANLYRDSELDIHPEFQRIYRWNDSQKTRLIESILLGIPLPPIFVAQRDDGVWDVIDGVQRLSTIFQFMGLLKDENGNITQPLTLVQSKILPSLNGKVWEHSGTRQGAFSKEEQLFIKRAKIDINIVLKDSDEEAKYELFMRLNTGGTPLTSQEVRNCLMVMAHPEKYRWLKARSEDEHFIEAIGLSDRSIEEKYHMELAFRFLTLRKADEDELAKIGDIGDYLNDKVAWLTTLSNRDLKQEEKAFKDTFKCIAQVMASDAFRRYDTDKDRFSGGFSISAFEAVALGLGFHHSTPTSFLHANRIVEIIRTLWSSPAFTSNSGAGIRASSRIPKIIPLGRKLFKP